MRNQRGFSLIELIVLIVVMGFLANTIVIALTAAARKTPNVLRNAVAAQTARNCMEWLIGQRRLNGYTTLTCPSSTVPTFCTSPTGYTVAVSITCTTINTDANYKTIDVTVSGLGYASLTSIVANY